MVSGRATAVEKKQTGGMTHRDGTGRADQDYEALCCASCSLSLSICVPKIHKYTGVVCGASKSQITKSSTVLHFPRAPDDPLFVTATQTETSTSGCNNLVVRQHPAAACKAQAGRSYCEGPRFCAVSPKPLPAYTQRNKGPFPREKNAETTCTEKQNRACGRSAPKALQ